MTSWALLLTLAATAPAVQQEPGYAVRIEDWRREVQASLMSENGWLSVAGLEWLEPGGSCSQPGVKFTRQGRAVSADVSPGVEATVDGRAFEGGPMRSDMQSNTTLLSIGTRTYKVIERGKRVGIRIYDRNSRYRNEFSGLNWYPVDPAYRIIADYVPYKKKKSVPILNVLGDTSMSDVPGYVRFTLGGRVCTLDAEDAGTGLFFNFHDASSGKTTYPAGRFLDTDLPKNGKVVLDFNMATNPPCAFTDFATCPLPPKQNFLSVWVPAGEKDYGHHVP